MPVFACALGDLALDVIVRPKRPLGQDAGTPAARPPLAWPRQSSPDAP